MRTHHVVSLCALLAAAGCAGGDSRTQSGEEPALIAAAASLRHAMPEAAEAFKERTGRQVDFTFGASGDLVRQVQGGAPLDAVILAAARPVDQLLAGGFLRPETRLVIASNELVLVGRTGSLPLTFATLDRIPDGERVAIGEPGAVPAGAYAKTALENLAIWDEVRPRAVFASDVAATIAYARRGEVAAAVVYRSEITSIHDVVLLDTASGSWAPRPEVVAAVASDGAGTGVAAEFLAFLAGPDGQKLLQARGFGRP